MRDDLGRTHLNVRRGLHDERDPLTEPRIGNADDRAGAHARQLHHDAFNLRGRDVRATPDDEEALAVVDVEEPSGIEPPDVAGVEPSVVRAGRERPVVPGPEHRAINAGPRTGVGGGQHRLPAHDPKVRDPIGPYVDGAPPAAPLPSL